MSQQILVPDIGDYSNVEVIDVAVKPGQTVSKEDTLITLETDKATMDIPAPYDVTIVELYIKKGDKVSKGHPIATVTTANIQQTNTTTTTQNTKTTQDTHTIANTTQDINIINKANNSFVHASPSARKFARELGVNLEQITNGTGKNGRITEDDIKQHTNKTIKHGLPNQVITNSNYTEIDFTKWGDIESQPLTRIKKKSGQNLHRSWISIPHVTHFEEADITELEKFRQEQQTFAKQQGLKLTILTFFIKAATNALKTFTLFNSSLSNDLENLIIKKYYNIGIAVDTSQGLVVPVVKNTDQKTLFELAADLANLSQKARENKLTAQDMQGGSFTISSLGGIGGTGFTPIINAPEVAILGISRSQLKPIYINGEVTARLILPLSLSYDHRVIDGAQAARFSKFIVEQLNNIECIKDKSYEYSN